MKIYDLVQYDWVDIYTRRDVTQSSWSAAQQRLTKWFETEMTDDVFLELINMKEFKNQNGQMADQGSIERFKDFMSNYYIDSPNITEKSYHILVDYAIKNDEFRHKTDAILGKPWVTAEIFKHALEIGYLGTDKYKWYNTFTSTQYSDQTLIKFIELTHKEVTRPWNQMIKNQKLSKKVIDKMLDITKFDHEVISDLAEHNHEVDEKTYLKMLQNVDLSEFMSLTGEKGLVVGIKKMMLRDRNFFEQPYNWQIIHKVVGELSTEYRAIVYSAALTFPNLNDDILDLICNEDITVLGYIVNKIGLDKLDVGNRVKIYEKTGHEDFLPDTVQDLFLF